MVADVPFNIKELPLKSHFTDISLLSWLAFNMLNKQKNSTSKLYNYIVWCLIFVGFSDRTLSEEFVTLALA